MTADTEAMARLRSEVDMAKEALSTTHSVRIELDALYDGHELKETLTRERFEKINDSLFKKTLGPLEALLEDADLKSPDAIDE